MVTSTWLCQSSVLSIYMLLKGCMCTSPLCTAKLCLFFALRFRFAVALQEEKKNPHSTCQQLLTFFNKSTPPPLLPKKKKQKTHQKKPKTGRPWPLCHHPYPSPLSQLVILEQLLIWQDTILAFGWHGLMEKGKRNNTQAYKCLNPPARKKNSTRVSVESWQHRQHCVFPATYRDGGKEAVRLDNKAATLVFILSWIITPESNGLIFCVRKKTCCLFGSSVILRWHIVFWVFFLLSLLAFSFLQLWIWLLSTKLSNVSNVCWASYPPWFYGNILKV